MKKSPRFRSQLCTHGFGGSVWSFGELMGSIVRGTQGGNAPFFVVKKTWSEVLFWHYLWKNWSEVKGNVIETMWMRVQFLVMQFLMFWSCCFFDSWKMLFFVFWDHCVANTEVRGLLSIQPGMGHVQQRLVDIFTCRDPQGFPLNLMVWQDQREQVSYNHDTPTSKFQE